MKCFSFTYQLTTCWGKTIFTPAWWKYFCYFYRAHSSAWRSFTSRWRRSEILNNSDGEWQNDDLTFPCMMSLTVRETLDPVSVDPFGTTDCFSKVVAIMDRFVLGWWYVKVFCCGCWVVLSSSSNYCWLGWGFSRKKFARLPRRLAMFSRSSWNIVVAGSWLLALLWLGWLWLTVVRDWYIGERELVVGEKELVRVGMGMWLSLKAEMIILNILIRHWKSDHSDGADCYSIDGATCLFHFWRGKKGPHWLQTDWWRHLVIWPKISLNSLWRDVANISWWETTIIRSAKVYSFFEPHHRNEIALQWPTMISDFQGSILKKAHATPQTLLFEGGKRDWDRKWNQHLRNLKAFFHRCF